MGFLKFMKKEDKKPGFSNSDQLDLPPPPQLGGFGDELPSFSGPKLETTLPPLKPFEPGKEFRASEISSSFPDIRPSFEQSMPFPSLPRATPSPQPSFAAQEEIRIPAPELVRASPTFPEPVLEKPAPSVSDEPVFVRSHVFRHLVEEIDSFAETKKLESKVSEIKQAKDDAYEKWSALLEDSQRDFMFIDKALFEV